MGELDGRKTRFQVPYVQALQQVESAQNHYSRSGANSAVLSTNSSHMSHQFGLQVLHDH